MAVELSVLCEELDEEDLQSLVLELARDLSTTTGVEVDLREERAPHGSKGDAITLGQIAITFLTSGAAVAAINVLKTYFAREPKLKFRFKTNDRDVTIDGSSLDGQKFEQVVQLAHSSMRSGSERRRS